VSGDPKPTPEELLAAWVSGPDDLSADERRAVEALLARSPEARRDADDLRALLVDVRAEGEPSTEPAWRELDRQVRAAIATAATATPWWRRWFALPAMLAASTAATIALVVIATDRGNVPMVVDAALPVADNDPPAPTVVVPAHEPGMWLDGDALALDKLDDASAAEIEFVLDDALDVVGAVDVMYDGPDYDDLEWVDELDDDELDALDSWLDRQPG
jgi:hypothetical protein